MNLYVSDLVAKIFNYLKVMPFGLLSGLCNAATYHIVASRNTCYYSENQKIRFFLFFKVSNTNMLHIFLGIKLFLFVKIERF